MCREKLNEMENEKQRLGGKLEQLEAERSKKLVFWHSSDVTFFSDLELPLVYRKKSFFRKIKGKLKVGGTCTFDGLG